MAIVLQFEGFSYKLKLEGGKVLLQSDRIVLLCNKAIVARFPLNDMG